LPISASSERYPRVIQKISTLSNPVTHGTSSFGLLSFE